MLGIRTYGPAAGAIPMMIAALLLVSTASVPARAEPPIRGIEDAACRAEARARVFTTPNPRGLELESIGRGIYMACMRRATGRGEDRPRRRRRR